MGGAYDADEPKGRRGLRAHVRFEACYSGIYPTARASHGEDSVENKEES